MDFLPDGAMVVMPGERVFKRKEHALESDIERRDRRIAELEVQVKELQDRLDSHDPPPLLKPCRPPSTKSYKRRKRTQSAVRSII